MVLEGETLNPIDLPSGCRFHPRCPEAISLCSKVEPHLEDLGEDHQAACLLVSAGGATGATVATGGTDVAELAAQVTAEQ